jgi:hypothetical protein
MSLSDAQFADTVNETGGASREWDTAAEPPKRGYMVSTPSSEAVHPGNLSAAQVGEHYRASGAEAKKRQAAGEEVYQGGWRAGHPDTNEPSAFLDVSTRHDQPWGAVKELSQRRGQLGAFHLPTLGNTYETHMAFRDMPGPQSNKEWASSPDRPSKYERGPEGAPELEQHSGTLNGKKHTLENVMQTIERGRLSGGSRAR